MRGAHLHFELLRGHVVINIANQRHQPATDNNDNTRLYQPIELHLHFELLRGHAVTNIANQRHQNQQQTTTATETHDQSKIPHGRAVANQVK